MLDPETKQQIVTRFELSDEEVEDLFESPTHVPEEIIDNILGDNTTLVEQNLLELKAKYAKTPANIITVVLMLLNSTFIPIENRIKYIHSIIGYPNVKNDGRYYNLILCLSRLYVKDVKHAEKRLKQILQMDDIEFNSPITYTYTLIQLSLIYRNEAKYEQAISVLKQALECYNISEKESIIAQVTLSLNYQLLNEYDTAISYLEPLKELETKYQENIFYYLATLYNMQGNNVASQKAYKKALNIVEKNIVKLEKNSYAYQEGQYYHAIYYRALNDHNKSLAILNSLLKRHNIDKKLYILICLLRLDDIYQLHKTAQDKLQAIKLVLESDGITEHPSYFETLYDKYCILNADLNNYNKCKKIQEIFIYYYKHPDKITDEQYGSFIVNHLKLNPSTSLSPKLQNRLNDHINTYDDEQATFILLLLKRYDEVLDRLKGNNSPFAKDMKIDAYINLKKLNFAVTLIDEIINEKDIQEDYKTNLVIKKIGCLCDLNQYEHMDELVSQYRKDSTAPISNIYDIYFQYYLFLFEINRIEISKENYIHAYNILITLVDFVKKENYQSKLQENFYDEILLNYLVFSFVFTDTKQDLNIDNLLKCLIHNEDLFKANLISLIFEVSKANEEHIKLKIDNTIEIIANIITDKYTTDELDGVKKLSKLKEFLLQIQKDLKYISDNNIQIIHTIQDFYNLKLSLPNKALYRGMNCVSWKIEPTIIREHKLDMLDSYYLANFQREAYALSDINLNNYNKLDWLSLMQHHGNLSPLLDWTQSLNVALFFALDDEKKSNLSIPVICTMEYVKIESHDDIQTRIDKDNLNDIILFAPKVRHKRLNRQSGVFTYHPSDDLHLEDKNNQFQVKRYALSPSIISDLQNLLRKDNINCSTIYPDLDFLSKHIRNDIESNFSFYSIHRNSTIKDTPYDRMKERTTSNRRSHPD